VPIVLQWCVFLLFALASGILCTYGLHLLWLTILFRRRLSAARAAHRETAERYTTGRADDDWPVVTTQIPLYNEADVAARVIAAVAAIDYPRERHEIQILDDSTDATRTIVDEAVARAAAAGADIKVVRRADRSGYKAGALAHALATARGEHVAIFDADFVPPVDFLRKAVAVIEADDNLACVQGRWAHLNRGESWVTEAQALGIDMHFTIEQGARAWNGLMMNFNGTAGLWRKAAIDDPEVGGWSGDTLTEDLDLSYRAQLAGWRIAYDIDLACPAELPGSVSALKSQQRRWATGSIQTAVKLLPRIWGSALALRSKVEATLHLTHYGAALCMLVLAVVARPMFSLFATGDWFGGWYWAFWGTIGFAAVAPSLTYSYARYVLEGGSALRVLPAMIVLGCGLCLNNALAVLRGLRTVGGEFVRTPKSGSSGVRGRSSTYRPLASRVWAIELVLGAYTAACFVLYLQAFHSPFSVFMFFYAIGFALIGWHSRPMRPDETPPLAATVPSVIPSGGQ
jgi:cellulose synthase/poly-beta-1,6-N-acetylglucosamine synthase-like glycosyltransferase